MNRFFGWPFFMLFGSFIATSGVIIGYNLQQAVERPAANAEVCYTEADLRYIERVVLEGVRGE